MVNCTNNMQMVKFEYFSNKMDSGNQVANIATMRWKTTESRRRVVKAIVKELIKQGSPDPKLTLNDAIQSVSQFEVNASASAKTQDEYISLVREQIKRIRARSWKTVVVKKKITNPSATEIDANGDWQEHVYERLQFLKQRYYYAVQSLYRNCCRDLQVDPSKEFVGLKRKSQLENILSLFELSKSQITADMKDQARKAEEYIRNALNILNKQPNRQQSPDVQLKQLFFGPSNSIFSQPNNMVSQDHRVAMPIGSSQHGIINQSSIVKGQSNAVKQQTNIAFQEFGVNNNTPRISATQAFGTRTKTERILPLIKESNAVKQETNIALQEFGVNNNAPRILATEAFGTRTNTERILPLIKESNDQNQGFHNTKVQSHAMQKLIRALTSVSPEALSAAVGEIEEVVHLNDKIPEVVDEQGLPIVITPGGWKMPRSFISTTCDTPSMLEGFNQFTYTAESNLNSFTIKGKHSQTVQENQNLLAEIKDINNQLFDCEVVIAEKENAKSAVGVATDQSEGLVVKILYNAVTINQNIISHFTADKKSLIEPLRLLIPSSYPSCSLVILDELPLEVSDDLSALSERAKEKLRFNLGKMNEPLLIKDIARVWERCAREAILDYAHANSGGSFTSMHGGLEAC
ncbi:unnamed protein product [Lathyrus oleraceus]|uniref:mediator of RNA polymerase II transcription subunit 15a isoform X3 n=1 Tax=Pisum sativum TaxID=3888 RepID=UPI0021D3073A|nr:mediator of RNA polymerase II transcription subunit 15a-like isoform X3 [Pisum sativum]